ncbi:hypothetical protein GXW82_02300 [Streptacidiphilus sp. 4-A2]|nr:hypothetical protein [Streptacidiphilus sp. 4-A2]
MSWIRRRTHAEPPAGRLPDLEFLALVQASLEEYAPGVTQGTELKGNSLSSPHGWVVAVAPPQHGGDQHYDVVALPDVSVPTDVPCFVDCVVAMAEDPRRAADAWVHTAGACMLELLDRHGRFADHAGPGDARGIPGWYAIASGAVGIGLDSAENRRLQSAVVDANILHRIADSFTADLEPLSFNGIKVFYGGQPGAMVAEVRINGERHEAASAAMAALGLPGPTAFTTVRYYALLLPVPADGGEPEFPSTRLGLAHHHDAAHGHAGQSDPEHLGVDLALPHLIAELSAEERKQRVRVDTGSLMIADGVGNFLKARLPIQLTDGRTVVHRAWFYLSAQVIDEFTARLRNGTLTGYRFTGLLCNAVGPWGEELLRAPVVLGGQQVDENGCISSPEVIESGHPLLSKVLHERWPAPFVLGEGRSE